MEIIPAVDIRGGRCVRLLQGRFDQETVFADDPVEMAVHWALLGARRLHVVDLDGAKTGQLQNMDVVARILRAVEMPIQFGGGIRDLGTARYMLALGVDRVIIGTSAAEDRELARAMFKEFEDQVVISLDARDEMITTHGWQEVTGQKAIDFALEMVSLGARRIIHTDISRDGMLSGVNINAMRNMVEAVDIPVIASGGVSNIEDIHQLKELVPNGLEGVVVGRAIYTGSLDLQEAIAVADR